ncbi:hypothetical protein RJ639_029195 [Escallonia herrerae]|uniref:Endoplasmic reticulum metallopeptidase 1 n=1 Tax=Escallonia herrerae TaxID=1293975 RepID=A0AA88X6I0_9ASTE|nr:hypothetical protein RJ639_029195 [Escallonia herrerae]
MAFRLSSGDIAGFKLLVALAVMYGFMSILAYSVMHMKFVKPLGADAPLDRFSEARAVEHEGRRGLKEAAKYIKTQLEMMKDRAGSNVRIEIEENVINGSFNMMFLGHSLSLGYRNHTNIVMRIASMDSQDNDASVLLNGHFDSPPGSPGAGDCGSCVASMLEIARLTVDSGWTPPRPLIFLFNGAEELFMLGSHGFITTHKWRDTVGAFINIEASGSGGLDVVCQSGPGPWPSLVYAQSALYPMANSAAQDVFGVAPGDTDYRIFATDHGDIPGLDIIFLHGGYFYHTSSDTVERLLPGSIQARGENLFSIIKAFTNSSKLRNGHERESLRAAASGSDNGRPIFFDYLSWFLIYYSRRQAMLLHTIPTVIFLLMPFLLRFREKGFFCSFATLFDFVNGMVFHASAILLAIVFPVIFSILRLLLSGHSMNWFANPYLSYMMFVPCSVAGLFIPRMLWRCFPLCQDVSLCELSKEVLVDEARFWGAFGLYSLWTLAYLVAGLSGGFLTFSLSAFMLPAWCSLWLSTKSFGSKSLRSTACYVIPLIPCLTYSVYFSGFLAQFLIEKMGMIGSFPPPYGYFVHDAVVAATIGVLTGFCMGPLVPTVGHWLARPSIIQFLLHISVLSLALSSQFFPYSMDAPKRIIFQNTIVTAGPGKILESSFDLSVVDSNSLLFLFKHVPEVAKELHFSSEYSLNATSQSRRESWMGIYPLSSLFSRSLKFPTKSDDVVKQYRYLPYLSTYKPQMIPVRGSRRVFLEFSLGSLEEVWVAVLNITGQISSWSLANNILPAPEIIGGGPPSYICRLSGVGHENWTFWLEANSSADIRIDVAVVDQYLMESAKKLKGLFPSWVDVIAYSSFLSTYIF